MDAPFFLLSDCEPAEADAVILPVPYEATVSYGRGTERGPRAIYEASTQVELWDDEVEFDLETLRIHNAPPLVREPDETPHTYLERLEERCRELRGGGLLVAVGGEHSLTPAVVRGLHDDESDLGNLTVVQFDAHADLRDSYEGTPFSHACAMRRLTERGASLIGIGIRSLSREESDYANGLARVDLYRAQDLANRHDLEAQLLDRLRQLAGSVYLTFDVDALTPALCPATGTPEPGGLGWWQTLKYLRALLRENRARQFRGCDVVETVPANETRVNEFTAARLIAKVLAYFAGA